MGGYNVVLVHYLGVCDGPEKDRLVGSEDVCSLRHVNVNLQLEG